LALGVCAFACGPAPARSVEKKELPPPPHAIPEAGDWATRVGQPPIPSAPEDAAPPEVRTAVAPDTTEDSTELVSARRLVYRVSLLVPRALQDRNARVTAAAGELHIDASLQRLRARFVGPGWPVSDGAEVRLRPDVPGVYLFDASGGRSIGPGQLASWFEGRDGGDVQSRVRVRREYRASTTEATPGHLLCALLAEWTNQPREVLDTRCLGESPAQGFRFGPFSAELTAVVPMQLPRYQLRADDIDAPALTAAAPYGAVLDVLDGLRPLRAATEPSRGALEVFNHTDTRAIIIVQGVPVGWVAAGARARFEGFDAGLYRVGAIRPLGILRMPPRPVEIPGTLVLGKPAR
jgi:hypothetical protein